MPYAKPSLPDLIEDARADIEAHLPEVDAHATNSVANVLSHVQAGGLHGLYGFLDWLSRQILPDTCDADILVRRAAQRGQTYLPAVNATGPLSVAGTNGAVLPADTILQASNGQQYRVVADAAVGTDAIVVATEAGAAGNLPAGARLALLSPVAGVQGTLTVAPAGLTGGADIESTERLRQRHLELLRMPPQGGSLSDYAQWAREAHPDVTRVWPSDENGPPYVLVRFVCDDLADGPIPPAAVVQAVQDYITMKRPVTARPTVLAPIADPVTLSISLVPDTLAVRDAVEAELRDLFRRKAEPGGRIPLSHIREAISIAAGEEDHQVVSPAADIVSAVGHFPILAGVTWL